MLLAVDEPLSRRGETLQKMDYRLSESSIFLISRAHRRVVARFEEAMGGELTAPQFLLLASLARLGAANQMKLVRASGIDRSTVSIMLRHLARKGLVRRRIVKRDTRQREAVLTEAGHDAVERGMSVEQALMDELALSTFDGYSNLMATLTKIGVHE